MPVLILYCSSLFFILSGHTLLCLFRRGRSPQPPAEEEEEDFDENLVAIDTCEYKVKGTVTWSV